MRKGIDATCPDCGENALMVAIDNLAVIVCVDCDTAFDRANLIERRARLEDQIRLLDHLAAFDLAGKPDVDVSLIDDAVA